MLTAARRTALRERPYSDGRGRLDAPRDSKGRLLPAPEPAKVCNRGHELSGHNLITRPNGFRQCRLCKRNRENARRKLQRAKAREAAKPPKPVCRWKNLDAITEAERFEMVARVETEDA